MRFIAKFDDLQNINENIKRFIIARQKASSDKQLNELNICLSFLYELKYNLLKN